MADAIAAAAAYKTPSNFLTRFIGFENKNVRTAIASTSLWIFILFIVMYIVAAFYPSWVLISQNPIYWCTQVLLFACAVYLKDDTAADNHHIHAIGMPNLLWWMYAVSVVFSLKPLAGLIQEASICSQFSADAQSVLISCTQAYSQRNIDTVTAAACNNLVTADVSNLGGTGQCAFMLGSTAYANFVMFCEFAIIILFDAKDMFLFYLVHIYCRLLVATSLGVKNREEAAKQAAAAIAQREQIAVANARRPIPTPQFIKP